MPRFPSITRAIRGPALLTALALAVIAAAPARADQRTAQMLPFFNTARVANGLPTVDQVNAPQETGCSNHLTYMALNGGTLVHGENAAAPGYTPEGNYQNGAGGSEVLSYAPGWSASHNPWETAPIHLYLMFDPTVSSTGYADDGRFACQRMAGSSMASAPLTFYAWTGSGGRLTVPYQERAAEGPYTPQQLVGIPADQATGPNIMVFSAGDLGIPVAATLAGPSGAVDVRLVNELTHNSVGNGSWFHGGGIIIPTAPLAPAAVYTATIAWSDQGQSLTQTFSFKTAGASPIAPIAPIALTLTLGARHRHRLALTVPGPAVGRSASVRVTARHYNRSRTITLKAMQTIRLPTRHGAKHVTVKLAVFSAGGQQYLATSTRRRYR